MVLNKDFREFIELLNKNEVKYLVIGGYAVAYYGYPRYTKDIDFWIWMNKNNAEKVIQTLKDFGFASLGITSDDLLKSQNVIQLGYPPNRMDLLMSLENMDFEDCYKQREDAEIGGITVSFIDMRSLIENKKTTGRLQDQLDVEKLEEGIEERD